MEEFFGGSPAGRPGPRKAPRGPYARRPSVARTASGVALGLAGILFLLSAYAPWWSITAASGDAGETITCYPGSDYLESVHNGSLSARSGLSYAGNTLQPEEGLYGTVLQALWFLALVCWLAAALALLTEFGALRGRTRRHAVASVAAVAVVVGAVLVAVVTTAQPGDWPACSGIPGSDPCTSFWGSTTTAGGTASWGAESGWWLAAVAAGVSAAGAASWEYGIQGPWTAEQDIPFPRRRRRVRDEPGPAGGDREPHADVSPSPSESR